MNSAQFMFPAVKGIQAGQDYYISMVPLETIPKLFLFSEDELPVEIRSQRTLNKARIPDICNYIVENVSTYVFSALTASVDGNMDFISINNENPNIGHLTIDMSARFLINDGQHRRAAIELAIKKCPDLRKENISVVFFRDIGLQRSQQIFSDLNKYAIRPTKSLNIFFDDRDDCAILVKEIITKVSVFGDLVDKEKTTLSNRAKALFTLSSIYQSTEALFSEIDLEYDSKLNLSITFWNIVANNISEWEAVKSGQIKSSELRRTSICSLSITIVALGQAGNMLLKSNPDDWQNKLTSLININWDKENPLWENVIMVNGKVVSSRASQQLLTETIYNSLVR